MPWPPPDGMGCLLPFVCRSSCFSFLASDSFEVRRPEVVMEGRGQGVVLSTASAAAAGQGLVQRLRAAEAGFRGWLARQPMAVEAALVSAGSAAQGAAIGALMGSLTSDLFLSRGSAGLDPKTLASLKQAQAIAGGPLVQARNVAVITGVNAGISCALKRVKGGIEDVQSSMLAAFGSGAIFSLVSGMGGGPNPAANAVTSGLAFAVFQGAFFMLGQQFSQKPAEDVFYTQTRSMLTNLGLEKYEKNFKKGLLTDNTLHLLTDSALRDVKIPPGPRLLILDHIDRDSELLKERT